MSSAIPLKINSLEKSFKEKSVLNGVSLEVKNGNIHGLIGVNGVGKTTMIKIILDLLKSNSGEASFFGKTVNSPESRRSISYLPEKFYPSQFLKGREFLSLAMSYYGKDLNLKKAKEKAAMLDLDPDVLEHRIGKYSKGMGQKLGLLSVFLSEAPLLILDEPMSGLDPSARIKLKKLLNEYKNQGNTIFFSSHILADIEEICDCMSVMHKGDIIYNGTAPEFLKKYDEKNLEHAFLKAIES